MKRIFGTLILTALLLAACGPKRIPSKKLVPIMRDIYLTNAYANMNRYPELMNDSASYYEPIFEKYGYTSRDFRYTLYKLSLLKSSNITEIVNLAAQQLQTEFQCLDSLKRLNDSLTREIVNHFRDTLYQKELVTVNSVAQIDAAKFRIDSVKKGVYTLNYKYLIDSTDKNYSQRSSVRVYNRDKRIIFNQPQYMTRYSSQEMKFEFEITDTTATKIEVSLIEKIPEVVFLKPSIRFDSIVLTRTLTIQEARQKFLREQFEEFNSRKYTTPHDTLAKDSLAKSFLFR